MTTGHNSRTRVAAALGVAETLGIAGAAAYGATRADERAQTGQGRSAAQPAYPTAANGVRSSGTGTPTGFRKNASGKTYGTAIDAQRVGAEPDLVGVVATNGKRGYAWNTELNPSPTGIAPTGAPKARTIPVYAEDGVTKIGEYTVGGGQVIVIPRR